MSKRLRILTWHVHGAYLYYLSNLPHDILVPVKPGRPASFAGRTPSYPWPANIIEVPAESVRGLKFDCILYQEKRNYLHDRFELLSDGQRALPAIYLEHDPPREHPTDSLHVVDDPGVLIVHVTHFNDLMWDSGGARTQVIEHGVSVSPGVRYSGELPRGIVVINNLPLRARRLGRDIFERVREEVPLDLVGISSEEIGGLGEVPPEQLPEFIARYRFFFNPIRYTSLGLAVCEAMMIGLPIVGLATTEMVRVVENGYSGYLDTDVDSLVQIMRGLIADPGEAQRLGEGARQTAIRRFNIERFVDDWQKALAFVCERTRQPAPHHDKALQETLA